MADTPRTLAALQALLADNTAGDISPQDVRDLLVSVMGAGGPGVEEIRPLKNQINESVGWNAVQFPLRHHNLLTATGAGTVELLWIVVSCADSPYPGCHTSTFEFKFNGESSPSITIKYDDLFCNRGQPGVPNFWHPYFGKTRDDMATASWRVGGYLRLPMPFQNGCIIDWILPNGGDSGHFWSAVDYHAGEAILPLRRKKLCVSYVNGVSVGYGEWKDLLNIGVQASEAAKKGELAGIQFFATSTVWYTFMEGNLEFFRDSDTYPGSPSFQASGTEDFFHGAFYFGEALSEYDVLPKTLGLDCGLIHKGTISGGS